VKDPETMRHLIFTAKDTGQRCVEYLLDNFPDDDYTFVLCEPGADATAAMLERRGLTGMRLSAQTLDVIRGVGEAHYDWLLNLWGGHIFKTDILSRARNSLNIHPAYLPYCRGRDPVVWAIRRGCPAGVTLHSITQGVDEGPIWYREEVPYTLPVRGVELYERVVERCWQAFGEQWAKLRAGEVAATPQDEIVDMATFRRSDLLLDRIIDLDVDLAARDLLLRLLAHDFSPGYSAQVVIGGKPYAATLSLTPFDASNS
jgi:methionyl-tRNA formyltransferase